MEKTTTDMSSFENLRCGGASVLERYCVVRQLGQGDAVI